MRHKRATEKYNDSSSSLPILFVGADLGERTLVHDVFRRHAMDVSLELVTSGKEGLVIIKKRAAVAVFVNQTLPDMDGFAFVREVRKLNTPIPVIMIMENDDEQMILKALREGAYDTFNKGSKFFHALPQILDRSLARHEVARQTLEKERLITESKKNWLAILDGITDFIFMTDAEGRIIKANRAVSNHFGKNPKFIPGVKYHDLFGTELQQQDGRTTLKQPQPFTQETSIDGNTYLMSSFPLEYDNKLTTIYVLKNITEIRRLREQLHHADKLASLGLLVSGVAHEINNPLTGVIAYAELLRMELAEKEGKVKVKKILDSAERCKKIVDNLLTFSRQQTSSKSLESINDIVERALDLRNYWLTVHNIQIVKDYDNMKNVFVDAQQLQQVILNIILNAEHALTSHNKQDGKITLVTRHDKDKNNAVVKIIDNGPGISADILPMIFDPFFTTKPVGVGTGLGLSISYGIVMEHGGTIRAESREGEGVTFTIELPFSSKDQSLR
ncbi:MAG: ATP-binding protein [Thermodesulfovibrionales bacterium]|jgi:PAS domain S-box-containing protein